MRHVRRKIRRTENAFLGAGSAVKRIQRERQATDARNSRTSKAQKVQFDFEQPEGNKG